MQTAASRVFRKAAEPAHDKPSSGRALRGKPSPLWDRLATNLPEATEAMASSRGEPLSASDEQRFNSTLGGEFRNVRIHADSAADKAARLLNARAVTNGNEIYFASGEYQPARPAGERLLLHELTHAMQAQGRSPVAPKSVSHPGDSAEQAAMQAETRAVAPSVAAPPGVVHRQVEEVVEAAIEGYEIYKEVRAYQARDESVELQGHRQFDPSEDLARWISEDESPVNVHIQFSDLAAGLLKVFLDENEEYQSDGVAVLPLSLPGLGDENATERPVLLVAVVDSVVDGIFGGVPNAIAAGGDAKTIFDSILTDGTERLMEWSGLENLALANRKIGELINGHLTLESVPFDFDLAGAFSGSGNLGIYDNTVTFDGSATLQVDGLSDINLTLARDTNGALSGTVQMAVTLAGIEGNLLASFGRGAMDIRGTAKLNHKNFEGTVTLMVTDEDRAWTAVNGELAQWPPVDSGTQPTLGPAGPPAPEEGQIYVVAGWGVVDFRYKDWLRGRAQVIVDPDGEITSLGRVHVPQEITLFEEKEKKQNLFTFPEASVPVAEVWDALVVHVGGSGSLDLTASIGPAVLRDIHASGAFSTREGFPNHLKIGGTFSIEGGAELALTVQAFLSLEVQVPIVGEITKYARATGAKASLNVTGTAALEAYAEAQAAIHRTQPKGSDEATYALSGTLAAGGSIFCTLKGNATVEFPVVPNFVHGPHVVDLGDRHVTLGSAHTSVPFRNFKIGDSDPPLPDWKGDKKPSFRKFLTDIVMDNEGKDPGDETGTWKNIGVGDEVGDEGQDPTPPAIPGDPHFSPTIPPFAPPPVQVGPPPAPEGDDGSGDSDSGDQDSGSQDAGTGDAGVPAIAGVPDQPEPPPPLPDAPPPSAAEIPVADVPFDMEGSPHHLMLEPGPPPVLLMASLSGRLELKLQRKRDEVQRRIQGNPIPRQRDKDESAALLELIGEAHEVEEEARRLGFGERFSGKVAGMEPLAKRIHTFAQQFEWRDIAPYLPTETQITPQPGEIIPDEAEEVLGLPYADFLAKVETMPPAEALPLLREQREYYAREAGDISKYLGARPTGETAEAVKKRYTDLTARVVELNRRIARLQDEVNPDGRPELPCFSADTLVWTPRGQVEIGSMQPGDALFTWDGAQVLQGEVQAVHRKATLQFYLVRAVGATVQATGQHPFWVEDRRDWVPACELKPGDHLRLRDGGTTEIESVECLAAQLAPTVDLSVTPYPTYFVGPGILVHNASIRHYGNRWRPPTQAGPFKIYRGTTTQPGIKPDEFKNSVYIGQTSQAVSKRQKQHREQAEIYLSDHAGDPDTDLKKRFYRFKKEITLVPLADGLLDDDQASWLEQANLEYEQSRGFEVLYLREELTKSKDKVKATLMNDQRIKDAGLCP